MRRRRHDERGAILPLTALIMVIVVGFTAFATDLGVQRVAARDMQAVADVAALDAARKLPTCTRSAVPAWAFTFGAWRVSDSTETGWKRLSRPRGLRPERAGERCLPLSPWVVQEAFAPAAQPLIVWRVGSTGWKRPA